MFQKRFARRWIAAGLLIILMGVIFEALLAISGTPQEQAATWPMVTGQVLSLDVRNVEPSGATLEAPLVLVEYRYQVNNTVYTGNQTIRRFASQAEAQAAFPVGQSVMIYYNPNAPLQSLLEPGAAGQGGQPLLAGPRMVLLSSACFAAIPFLAIGILLALAGTNTPQRYLKRFGRRS